MGPNAYLANMIHGVTVGPGGQIWDANLGQFVAPWWRSGRTPPKQSSSGGSSGSGGGSGTLSDALSKAYKDAREANERRYAAIRGGSSDTDAALGGYLGRYERGLANLEGLGAQEKADVDQHYNRLGSSINQGLVTRGLNNSTVAATTSMGVARERNDAMSRVNERLQNQRLGLDAALSGDQLAFMERRNDLYPDYGLAAQIGYQQGAGGVGVSGGTPGMPIFLNPSQLGYQIPQGAWGPGGNMFGLRGPGGGQQMTPDVQQLTSQIAAANESGNLTERQRLRDQLRQMVGGIGTRGPTNIPTQPNNVGTRPIPGAQVQSGSATPLPTQSRPIGTKPIPGAPVQAGSAAGYASRPVSTITTKPGTIAPAALGGAYKRPLRPQRPQMAYTTR